MNKSLRIGGVPEHFNLPWHLAIESGAIDSIGIEAHWTDYPEGTGSMVEALNAGEVDIAMLLTEGALKGQSSDSEYEIVSFYTETPLIWGVHVPAASELLTLSDLVNTPFAISRYGSGSHMMAYLFAQQQGWDDNNIIFEPIGDMSGARELFRSGNPYIFLWEKFMTQPLVDKGEFRRLGELPTPWPCFVICVHKSVLSEYSDLVTRILNIVLECAQELKQSPIAEKLIAGRYGLEIESVHEWLAATRWSDKIEIDPAMLKSIILKLKKLDLL